MATGKQQCAEKGKPARQHDDCDAQRQGVQGAVSVRLREVGVRLRLRRSPLSRADPVEVRRRWGEQLGGRQRHEQAHGNHEQELDDVRPAACWEDHGESARLPADRDL